MIMDSSPSKILLIHRFVGKYPWKINRDKKKTTQKERNSYVDCRK